ncbi:uncharacterized protein UV8b_01752 [Ustilaginoidea virens]|uniref:Uncharacterized protein n=1 Tax=Ustilaginoidea virens TaxID=1159556 RepID=A0A8E5MFH7_USTVR|nr:uncharacterized protein UV8b_01752 [Ustilaginoidea virens]QUC17511.1 hypothetical protein UV8b_01752 [Ustilaginoidea virens]
MQLAIALIASLAPLTLAKEDHWQKSWQWFKRWQDFDAHIRALTPELESVVGVARADTKKCYYEELEYVNENGRRYENILRKAMPCRSPQEEGKDPATTGIVDEGLCVVTHWITKAACQLGPIGSKSYNYPDITANRGLTGTWRR